MVDTGRAASKRIADRRIARRRARVSRGGSATNPNLRRGGKLVGRTGRITKTTDQPTQPTTIASQVQEKQPTQVQPGQPTQTGPRTINLPGLRVTDTPAFVTQQPTPQRKTIHLRPCR